ncbi:hypothetical protein ACLB2K_011414 [Fragaria x ananassa]
MMTSTSTSFCKNALVLLLLSSLGYFCSTAADPTDGFTRVSLTNNNFKLQKPYDKSVAERYSKVDGVETFKVYTNDKPFEQGSPTRPRTEIRVTGYDYTSGVWQFEGSCYVPSPTTGVIIMQVFGAADEATTLQLRNINGDLMYYNKNVVVSNVYNKWVRVNVIHNVGAKKVTIFVDGVQKMVMDDHGPDTHYFKYGAYAALTGSSNYMESSCIKMNSFCYKLLCLLLLSYFFEGLYLCAADDPTDGFTLVPLTEDNFKLQKPYNEPLYDRYSYKDGVRRFWIYNNDKPYSADSPTRPRSELRISGHDYSSGIWQFEGYAYVPSGTSGVTIVQIHGASEGATTLQLRMYEGDGGDLRYYRYNLVDTDLYDKWFRVNIIHNVDKGKVIVFIDGVKKFVVKDQGPGDLYFKCGVYAAPFNSSNYMESRWKGIKLYKK